MSDDPVGPLYDRWAGVYDDMPNATRDLDARVLRSLALPVDGRDVVELGAGTGKNTVWLAENARSVVAVDLSAGMLERARERVRAPHVRFVEHLAPVFAETRRVLRVGGQFFLCELHPFRQLAGGQAQFPDPATGDVVRVPAFVHEVSEYLNAALDAGFTLLRLGEWREEEADRGRVPRLLSAQFAAG